MLHPVFGFYEGMDGSRQATADGYVTFPTVDRLQSQLHVGKLFVSHDVVESEGLTVGRLYAVWEEVLQKAFRKAISSPLPDLLGRCRLRGLDVWPPAVGTTDEGGGVCRWWTC